MHLSSTERTVLLAIQHKANVSIPEFARGLEIKEHVARRALRKLVETGVVKLSTVVNLYALGYREYNVHFSLSSNGRGREDKLIQSCIDSDCVTYLSEISGDFQYAMSLCVRDFSEVYDFFMDLTTRFGAILFDKSVSGVISITDYGVKALADARQRPDPIRIGIDAEVSEIDVVDHQILKNLVGEPGLTATSLARLLGIPMTTIVYRLKQLEAKKILLGSRYIIFGEFLQLSSYRLVMKAKGVSLASRSELFQFCASHPAISFAIELLGGWDYELGLRVSQQHDVVELSKEVNRRFGEWLNSTKLISTFRLLKLSKYPLRTLRGNK